MISGVRNAIPLFWAFVYSPELTSSQYLFLEWHNRSAHRFCARLLRCQLQNSWIFKYPNWWTILQDPEELLDVECKRLQVLAGPRQDSQIIHCSWCDTPCLSTSDIHRIFKSSKIYTKALPPCLGMADISLCCALPWRFTRLDIICWLLIPWL
jgi:hypothetical protein